MRLNYGASLLGPHLSDNRGSPRIAILVPCCNEEATIGKVVATFAPRCQTQRSMSTTTIRTTKLSGGSRRRAVVGSETCHGKGNVVRRLFADIEADIYILVDGDDEDEADAAPRIFASLTAPGAETADGQAGTY
jgi:cellulose synthase/poly-beta-1,6-N-acetylglucosamine synthase-like glycosyltransferase